MERDIGVGIVKVKKRSRDMLIGELISMIIKRVIRMGLNFV
jgi:hypothetical protein